MLFHLLGSCCALKCILSPNMHNARSPPPEHTASPSERKESSCFSELHHPGSFLTISEPLDWSQLHPRLLFKTLFLNLSPQKCPQRRTWHALSKIEGWNPSLCALCFCSDLIINWDMGRPRVRHSLEGKEQVGTGRKGRWKEGSHQQSGEWTGRVSEYVAGGPKRERDWGPRRSERELFLQFPSDMEKSS